MGKLMGNYRNAKKLNLIIAIEHFHYLYRKIEIAPYYNRKIRSRRSGRQSMRDQIFP
jgi:hypothetical protein